MKALVKSFKRPSKGRYALIIGIAGGFSTLAVLAISIYDDNEASEIAIGVAIFCSLLPVFLTGSNDLKTKPCADTKTNNA